MTKKTYSEKLRDPRWQKKRLEIMDRDRFRCTLCGDGSSTLNVHHLSYHGEPWEAPDGELTTVCCHCHDIISHFDVDITSLISSPFLCCQKYSVDNSITCVLQHAHGLLICRVTDGVVHKVANFPDAMLRDIMQDIANTWKFFGKNLIIDQTPIPSIWPKD